MYHDQGHIALKLLGMHPLSKFFHVEPGALAANL